MRLFSTDLPGGEKARATSAEDNASASTEPAAVDAGGSAGGGRAAGSATEDLPEPWASATPTHDLKFKDFTDLLTDPDTKQKNRQLKIF